jgi:polar amino acid transport system permease protein
LNPSKSIYPAAWSRQRRSAATIILASFCMVLFLWSLSSILSFFPAPIGPAAKQFASGAVVTLQLTAVSGPLGILLGILVALSKLSRFMFLRWAADFYIWVLRGTPLLVQVMFAYYALPASLELSEFNAAVLALALNVGAYNAEAIRSGILAVHKGQTEAARSLGLSPFQTFRDVVFPQAFRVALPPLVNNVVALLKDSSLAYVIGVVELSNIANRVRAESFEPIPVFITIALIYLVMTTIMTQISDAIERQLDVERHA